MENAGFSQREVLSHFKGKAFLPPSNFNYMGNNPNREHVEDVLTQECSRCGLVLTFYPHERHKVLRQHQLYCRDEEEDIQEQLQSKVNLELQKNLAQMSSLKVGKHQNFYFRKVAANQDSTIFRWKKEKCIKISREIMKRPLESLRNAKFQQKFVFLRTHLESKRIHWSNGAQTLKVDKTNVILSSLPQLQKINFFKELKIQFNHQKVNDAGGLLRQWMHLAIKQIFERGDFCLFQKADTDQLCYKINPDKSLDIQFACQIFQLLGLIFGKALFQRLTLDCYLDRTFLRLVLNQVVFFSDVYSFDKGLYKSWKHILNCSKEQLEQAQIEYVVSERNGEKVTFKALDQNYSVVTIQNREKFVIDSIRQYTYFQIQHQINAFKRAFAKIIPLPLVGIFQPEQLQMMLYGIPFVNIQDLVSHTIYKGEYSQSHIVIKWFWKFMRKQSQSNLRRFLQFLTGSQRPPIFGFSKLESNRNNISQFCIQSVALCKQNPFPKAHTCFNRLQLPRYDREEQLVDFMRAVIQNNLQGVYGLD